MRHPTDPGGAPGVPLVISSDKPSTAAYAIAGGDGIVIGGVLAGEYEFQDHPPVESLTASDGFVVELAPEGGLGWDWRIHGTAPVHESEIDVVARTSDGDWIAVGSFTGHIDGTTLVAPSGARSLVIARLRNGAPVWMDTVGGTGTIWPRDAAIDPEGGLVVTGAFAGAIDFGDGVRQSVEGTADAFVARFSITTGLQLRWLETFGGPGDDEPHALAIDPTGDVLVGGQFDGHLQVGSLGLESRGGTDGFLVRFER